MIPRDLEADRYSLEAEVARLTAEVERLRAALAAAKDARDSNRGLFLQEQQLRRLANERADRS